MNRGKFIVLEGPAGSGKSTQAEILLQRLEAAHLSAKLFNYPDISNSLIARSINRLKNNPDYDLSHASRVLLDAVMSSETMRTINQALSDGVYCICESSYISTIVKYCYLNDIDNYEDVVTVMSYANMTIKPDLTIIFDAPPKTLIDRKYPNNFDLVPSIDDIEKVRTGYLLEAKAHNYPIIFSTDSIDSIASLVWDQVAKCLAVRAVDIKNEAESIPTSVSEILNYKTESIQQDPSIMVEENITIIDAIDPIEVSSQNFVDSVLKTNDNVYGFKDRLDIVPIAASLARSKGDDLEDLLIEEFSAQEDGGLKEFKKVIDSYGLDAIKQLSSHYLVIEGISNLLLKKIESELAGLYLEQPSSQSRDYFIPKPLDDETKKDYRRTLNKIYANHKDVVDKLTRYLNKANKTTKLEKINNETRAKEIAKNLLPVAAKSSIAIFASNQKIESTIKHLITDSLNEANVTGKRILSNMKQLDPMFFGNLSNLKKDNSNKTVKDILKQKMKNGFSSDFETVALIDFYPKNEIDLVPYMLYEHSELSLNELRNEVNKWSYEDKNQVFESYINNHKKDGQVLETVRYSLDIVCDYDVFKEFLDHKVGKNITWQDLTPRYGYGIPKIIEDANLVAEYEECFDLSLKLYSQMKLKNYNEDAQYATLFGHRMRFQVTCDFDQIYSIIESSKNDSQKYKAIISNIYDKLSEVHPLTIGPSIMATIIDQNTKKSISRNSKQRTRKN